MRIRQLDPNYDMQFGQSQGNFLVNSPAAVAQLVRTRLLLSKGEWFLDVTDGTPWLGEILGLRTQATRDQAIKARILGAQGVTSIASYSSTLVGRAFTVQATINTLYGQTTISVPL